MTRYPHAPGTTWRRALRRVDRRAANSRALRPFAWSLADWYAADHCDDCAASKALHREAVRLANRLYLACVDRGPGR